MFLSIKNGILEIVSEFVKWKCNPYVVRSKNELGQNILASTILEREDKIFNHLKTSNYWNQHLVTSTDEKRNNVLHLAASLPQSSQLSKVAGAALQMQRELQWFEEVAKLCPPYYIVAVNADNKNPKELFSEEHKRLVKEGEEWVKTVATSSTVVAALIATIMFAAIFTAPGGYKDHNGEPRYLYRHSFLLFMISDAVSLFLSSSSVLIFLGLLTMRYKEADFLKSVPRKLVMGLVTLFFSVVTMMITFGSAIVIMLEEGWPGIKFPIILLASIPAIVYAIILLPLLFEIFTSTFG